MFDHMCIYANIVSDFLLLLFFGGEITATCLRKKSFPGDKLRHRKWPILDKEQLPKPSDLKGDQEACVDFPAPKPFFPYLPAQWVPTAVISWKFCCQGPSHLVKYWYKFQWRQMPWNKCHETAGIQTDVTIQI